jgi:tetratricopeptide (TPR) repeat protein
MSDRLKQLTEFYNEDPNDPFNIYGLALEYLKTDSLKSLELFEKLIANHPDYVPTYYHAARLLQDLNERARAIEVYQKGMLIARKANNNKALRELQSAHDELVFE